MNIDDLVNRVCPGPYTGRAVHRDIVREILRHALDVPDDTSDDDVSVNLSCHTASTARETDNSPLTLIGRKKDIVQ